MGPQEPAEGGLLSSGGRTRTPNNRARTCRVADYTTPEWADRKASGLTRRPESRSLPVGRSTEAEPQVAELSVPDDPADADCDRFLQEIRHGREALYRGCPGRRGERRQAESARDRHRTVLVERVSGNEDRAVTSCL